jgi:TRAP-type C4-dicarboxylate transport system permease small subunit
MDLEQRSREYSEAVAILGLIGLIAVTLLTIGDVLLRWLFLAPMDGLHEVIQLLYAIIMASFFPAALAGRRHISIRFLGNWLGPEINARLDAFGDMMTFVFFVLVGWQFIVFTGELVENNEITWILAWPVAPWWGVATLLLLLCIPVQFIVLLRRRPGGT